MKAKGNHVSGQKNSYRRALARVVGRLLYGMDTALEHPLLLQDAKNEYYRNKKRRPFWERRLNKQQTMKVSILT